MFMKKLFYAMILSLFLATFSLNAGVAVAADEAGATDTQAAVEPAATEISGEVAMQPETTQSLRQAIDNLKTAINDFESTQQASGEDEHLRAAVDNAKVALDNAEKSMEHARMYRGEGEAIPGE
jgi:uncharacterized protein YlxW (UPF0749 family)